jgi:hypothetical protein
VDQSQAGRRELASMIQGRGGTWTAQGAPYIQNCPVFVGATRAACRVVIMLSVTPYTQESERCHILHDHQARVGTTGGGR